MPNDELRSMWRRAQSLVKSGAYSDAIPILEEITRRAPEKAALWGNLAIAHQEAGDHAAAIRAYETALEKSPDHQLSHLGLGSLYLDAGELGRAEACLSKASVSPQGQDMVYSLMGILRGKQERWKESEEFCRKALEANPSFEEAQLNLGIAFLRQGRVPEANKAIRRALQLVPGYEEAEQALKSIRRLS